MFIPAQREPRVMPIGEQTVPVPPCSTISDECKGIVATSLWLDKGRGSLSLHIGDMEDDVTINQQTTIAR
jgi:hypothetical protein